jgi:hypothetical protein
MSFRGCAIALNDVVGASAISGRSRRACSVTLSQTITMQHVSRRIFRCAMCVRIPSPACARPRARVRNASGWRRPLPRSAYPTDLVRCHPGRDGSTHATFLDRLQRGGAGSGRWPDFPRISKRSPRFRIALWRARASLEWAGKDASLPDLEKMEQALHLDGQIMTPGAAIIARWKMPDRQPPVLLKVTIGRGLVTMVVQRFEAAAKDATQRH